MGARMKRLFLMGFILSLLLTSSTGCDNNDEDLEDTIQTNVEVDSTDSTEEPVVFAPYVLTDYGDTYTDPFPLREINYTGNSKLKIEDQSSQGMDQLELFIQNLKMAVYQKDADQLLSMTSDDITYTSGIGQGKVDFSNEYDLVTRPETSKLWAILESILIYGGRLEYADVYHIPYMYNKADEAAGYNAYVIGDGINLRSDSSVSGDIVGQMNFDKILILEKTWETYDIDGIDYNWVKLRMMNGTEGYMVDKYIYSEDDYHITIDHANGYWEIVSITTGE